MDLFVQPRNNDFSQLSKFELFSLSSIKLSGAYHEAFLSTSTRALSCELSGNSVSAYGRINDNKIEELPLPRVAKPSCIIVLEL